jgi:hypothetical protein
MAMTDNAVGGLNVFEGLPAWRGLQRAGEVGGAEGC